MESLPLKPNIPAIIFEKFDHEVVVINLDEGIYYSIEQAGYPVWILIEKGMNLPQLTEALWDFFKNPPPDLAKILDQYVRQLRDEGLVTDALPVAEGDKGFQLDQLLPEFPREFHPPVLKKFTDQRELLLLDPIHEVDHLGWPERAETSSRRDE